MQQSAAVREFLSGSPLGPWIDGQTARGAAESAACIDPGTGEPFAEYSAAAADDASAAVASASKAFRRGSWAGQDAVHRAKIIHRLADLATQHRKTLAEIECLDTGRTLAQGLADVTHFAATLHYYADLAAEFPARRELASNAVDAYLHDAPSGVSGVIIPWNFPLVLLGWNIAPALVAGNSVVVKPAEDAVLSTLYVARLAKEAGLPDGVLNIIPGAGESAGAALAAHPAVSRMSFTGSTEVGRSVAVACAHNLTPVKLELGGKGAAIVMDLDDPTVVRSLVKAITMNAGQVCCTATRWLVPRSLLDQFLNEALERLRTVRIGYWSDLKTRMGPVISQRQLNRIVGLVERAISEGAEPLLWDGQADDLPGFYVRPGLLTGPPDNIAAREEIFGPIAYVLPFGSEDEAVALANEVDYGLADSVWSSDRSRAQRIAERLHAGTVWINAHNLLTPGIPYLPTGRSGYGGGALGPDVIAEHVRRTSISSPRPRPKRN